MENKGVVFPPEQFDRRRQLMYDRLSQLSMYQLMRIYTNREKICTDEYNYDLHTGYFCPIAYALDAHTWVTIPTNEKVREYIAGYFKEVNVLKGVPGAFYHGSHEERLQDLLTLVKEIVEEKKKQSLDGLNQVEDVQHRQHQTGAGPGEVANGEQDERAEERPQEQIRETANRYIEPPSF